MFWISENARFYNLEKLGAIQNDSLADNLKNLYKINGERLPSMLDGEFSFAFFDAQNQHIFACRDYFGIHPAYYALDENNTFLIEDNPLKLIEKGIKNDLNPTKIVHYLQNSTEYEYADNQTFFKHIFAIPAGHYLTFKDNKIQLIDYKINSKLSIEIHNQNKNSFASPPLSNGRFKRLIRDSIEKRIQNHKKIASHLSGGLDSSSITCLLDELKISENLALTSQAGYDSTDEKEYIESVLSERRINHQYIAPSEDIIASIRAFSKAAGHPQRLILPVSFHDNILRKVQELGFEILLTGHDGDSIVGYGFQYFEELLNQKKWAEIKEILSNLAQIEDYSERFSQWNKWNIEKRIKAQIKWHLMRDLKAFFKKKYWEVLKNEFKISYFDIFKEVFSRILNKKANVKSNILKDKWLKDNSSKNHISFQYPNWLKKENQEQFKAITNANFTATNEDLYILGRMYRIEILHPFFDRNLADYCLHVSEKDKFANGYGRGTLREGMKGVLPEKIRMRKFKTNFNEYAFNSLKTLHEKLGLFHQNHPIWEFADRKKAAKMLSFVLNDSAKFNEKIGIINRLNRFYFLGIWLDERK